MREILLDFGVRPFLTAVRTLTIIPLPGKDTDKFSRTLFWFPLVGGLLSLVLYGLSVVFMTLFPEQDYLTAVLLFAGMAYVTGGLHLDGLADAVDAFGSGASRERMLEIMKDSCQGTFGVLALIIDALVKVALYYALIQEGAILIVLLSLIVSRGLLAPVLAFLPYARKDGGTAQYFCNDVASRPSAIIASLAVMAACFVGMSAVSASVCFLSAVCGVILFAWYCMHKLGGITGDCIGAMNEIGELVFLSSVLILKNMGI